MRNFNIKSYHTIFVDDYKEGEGEQVNYYTLDAVIGAETAKQAVTEYFAEHLNYQFDIDKSELSECGKYIQWSVLVDADNAEAIQNEIDLWKNGTIKLYANRIEVSAELMMQVDFNDLP